MGYGWVIGDDVVGVYDIAIFLRVFVQRQYIHPRNTSLCIWSTLPRSFSATSQDQTNVCCLLWCHERKRLDDDDDEMEGIGIGTLVYVAHR